MKSLATAAIVLAFINLFGVVSFVGMLWATDRLDVARLRQIKDLLAETVPEQNRRLEADKAAQAEADKKAAEALKMSEPPEPAAEKIERQKMNDELARQNLERLRDELRQLRAEVDRRQAQIDTQKQQLADREKRFEQRKADVSKAAETEQFKAALAALEAQQPADGRKVLQALIDTGQIDQVITYLAAMAEKSRSRILGEFIKTDDRLAAQLLEQLRTRGVEAPPAAASAGRP